MSIHWRELPTSGKIEAVRSVWYSGISASQIAANLDGATRNAVIGLYGRYPEDLADTPLNKPTKSVVAMTKANTGRNFTIRKPRAKQPDIEAAPTPVTEPVFEWHVCGKPLMMLERYQCKWPVNDAAIGETHLFCSMPTEKSFCEAHHSQAYTKPRKSAEKLGEYLRRLR